MGDLAKAKYITLLLVMLLLGAALIVIAAFWGTSLEETNVAALLQRIREISPNLTADQRDSLAAYLKDWQAHLATDSFRLILIRDLGIAILVALILTVVIETHARQRFQEEMRRGVVEAVFQRLIPASIFEELRDQVIGAKSTRKDWELNMIILPEKLRSPTDDCYFLSRTTLSYKIINTTTHAQLEVIRSWLDKDLRGEDSLGILPRYERVTIGRETFEGDTLRAMLNQDGFSYETTRPLLQRGADEYVQVVNQMKQIIRVPDTFVWNMVAPTEGARITIDTALAAEVGFEIRALHPDRTRLIENPPGQWMFKGGFLPWQGFEIRVYGREQVRQRPQRIRDERQ